MLIVNELRECGFLLNKLNHVSASQKKTLLRSIDARITGIAKKMNSNNNVSEILKIYDLHNIQDMMPHTPSFTSLRTPMPSLKKIKQEDIQRCITGIERLIKDYVLSKSNDGLDVSITENGVEIDNHFINFEWKLAKI